MGIKSLECNFNPRNRTYNPHLHLLVPNQEIAEILIKEWQAKWTSQYTSPLAQHKRRVTNLERDLVETIKYGSKIFTDFDALQKGRIPPKIYLAAFENIYRAMKLYRLFDRFGFNLAKTEKISVTTEVLAAQRNEYIFTAEILRLDRKQDRRAISALHTGPAFRMAFGRRHGHRIAVNTKRSSLN